MVYGMEYLHIVCLHAGARNAWVKKQVFFSFSFLFVGILTDE
jgi:hypothetical protein